MGLTGVAERHRFHAKRCLLIGHQLQLSISANFVLESSEVQNSAVSLNIEFQK